MQHKKKNISRNKWRQVGKVLCKLMINTIRGKTKENVRNRIDVRVANNKKVYSKWTSKPNYMPHKIFDNNLVA